MDCFGNYPGTVLPKLHVKGDTQIDGDLSVGGTIDFKTLEADKIYTSDGDVGNPSHSFKDAKTTGIWRETNGDVSISRAGTKRMRIADGQTTFYDTTYAQLTEGPLAKHDSIEVSGATPQIYSSSSADLQIYTQGGQTHFTNNSIPSLWLSDTLVNSKVPFQSDQKATATYYDFLDDTENSKIYFDTETSEIKVQVHGDHSITFVPKGFTCINGTCTDAFTTPSLTTTSAQCSTLTASTSVISPTLSLSGQSLSTFHISGTPAIANNTTTALAFNTTVWEGVGTPVTTSGGGTIFSIPTTGTWLVRYNVIWSASGAGYRTAGIRLLPAFYQYGFDQRSAVTVAGQVTANSGSYAHKFNAGDTVSLMVYQFTGTPGATLNIVDVFALAYTELSFYQMS